uniref:Conserved_ORF_3 protein n=1 Tax=Titanophycus setchellii TaxID=940129 RepID=A0A1G4NYI2_9FLOR|nr:hypothetical protein P8471_pgp133 [Titanophycus setchellii]SCW23576.1 conserved_ORF_3 [Titanophycus setchellii]
MPVIIQDLYTESLIITKVLNNRRQHSLFFLQKKIYQASQECNTVLVHSLQKLLISLTSIRGLAADIQKTNLDIIDQRKNTLDVVKPLGINDTDELLILWCLEAEWKPKIKICYKLRYQINHITKWSHIYICNPTSLQNIDKQYILSKMQSMKWIYQKIRCYLDKQYFIQERTKVPLKYKNTIQFKLVDLLYMILTLGIDWNYYRQKLSYMIDKKTIDFCLFSDIYIFNTKDHYDTLNKEILKKFLYNIGILTFRFLETDCLCKTLTKIKHIQNNHKRNSLNELMLSIKSLLYSKNNLGYYRIRLHMPIKVITNQVSKLISTWTAYHYRFKDYICTIRLYEDIFYVLKSWAKKNKKQMNYKIIKTSLRSLLSN